MNEVVVNMITPGAIPVNRFCSHFDLCLCGMSSDLLLELGALAGRSDPSGVRSGVPSCRARGHAPRRGDRGGQNEPLSAGITTSGRLSIYYFVTINRKSHTGGMDELQVRILPGPRLFSMSTTRSTKRSDPL